MRPGVLALMDSIALCFPLLGASEAVSAFRLRDAGSPRRSFAMSIDSERPTDAAQWSRLIEAVAARQDRDAFAELFEHFAPRVKTFMRRSGASEASAEEVAQETLLTVWRKAKLFDPSSAGASAWIFTIARNLRIDLARSERRRQPFGSSDVDAEFQVDPSPLPEARLVAAQSEARVRAALAELSEEQMRVVELSFYEEKTHPDIAETLRIPLGTVKSRLRLAMKRLRGRLGDVS